MSSTSRAPLSVFLILLAFPSASLVTHRASASGKDGRGVASSCLDFVMMEDEEVLVTDTVSDFLEFSGKPQCTRALYDT